MSRPQLAQPAEGIGSLANSSLEDAHNGLLPPQTGQGPHLPPPALRAVEDFDVDLYAEIAETLIASPPDLRRAALRDCIARRAISWTMCTTTLRALRRHAEPMDW